MTGGYRIGTCLVCGVEDARWYITREGDVVATWADDQHLAMVLEDQGKGRPSDQCFIVKVSHAASRSAE